MFCSCSHPAAERGRAAPKLPITVVPQGGKVDLAPFEVQFIRRFRNSISRIEQTSPFVRNTVLVVHTGDWKLDDAPFYRHVTNAEDFKGSLAMRA